MINSFWNLCRACPMPTEEKLNSEYARNFTWHQGYQATNIEPVKKAPEATSSSMMEPVIPRKKKYPDVAYRTHQVLKHDGGKTVDTYGLVNPSLRFAREHLDIRARSEERSNISCKMGPRSRSADPNVGREKREKKSDNPGDPDKAGETETGHAAKGKEEAPMALSYPPPCRQHGNPGPYDNPGRHAGDQGIKTTEYRSQYAWPRGMEAAQPATRKSVSMGSIAAQALQMEGSSARLAIAAAIPILPLESQRKVDLVPEASVTSVRVIETKGKHKVDGKAKPSQDTKRLESNPFFLIGDHWKMKKTEYKAKFRPFSSYVYIDGGWKKPSKLTDVETKLDTNPWYTEVVERLKKADEYRWRAHGTPIYGEKQGICSRQPELWSQMREKGILPIASTPRPSAREDKVLKERPGTAPVPRIAPHRKERKEREPKSEKSPRQKASRKKETEISDWQKTEEKPGARPKSAEPYLSSKGEGKSPRHQIKPITTPPQLRSSSKSKDSMLNGPSESSGTEGSKPRPVSSRSSFKAAKGSATEHILPSSKSRPIHTTSSSVSSVVNGDGKIWLKPVSSESKSAEKEKGESKKDDESEPIDRNDVVPKDKLLDDKLEPSATKSVSDSVQSDITDGPISSEKKEIVRPNTLPSVNGMDMKDGRLNGKDATSPSSLPEPFSGPVPLTTVRSPEEVTGVKSPDPESWTVSLETGEEPTRAKSPPIALPSKSVEPFTPQVNSEALQMQKEPETTDPVTKAKQPSMEEVPSVEMVSPSTGRLLASDVLDRARSRLDQFWSKNK